MKKIFFLVFISILPLIILAWFLVQNAAPNWSGFYEVKRFEEKIILSLQFTDEQKAQYMEVLLGRRLEDLQRVVESKKYDFYYTTSLRYGTQAGELTDFILAKQLENRQKTAAVLFQKHQKEIRKLFDTEDARDDTKFIQDAGNYLDIYSTKLSQ